MLSENKHQRNITHIFYINSAVIILSLLLALRNKFHYVE